MSNLEDLKKEILDNLDHGLMVWNGDDAKFGDFLVTGPTAPNFERVLGYVVQVRKGWGAFGSDRFLIRTADEGLMTHENQCFWKLTEEQVEEVKPFFSFTPEDELKDNPELIYSIRHDQEEKGFLVDKTNAPERTDSFAMTITTRKAG